MTKRKPNEPACRACGCTEHNACEDGCSWVKVEKRSPPLCSACSGTVADMAESVARGVDVLAGFTDIPTWSQNRQNCVDFAVIIGKAALRRRNVRAKSDTANQDPTWGGR